MTELLEYIRIKVDGDFISDLVCSEYYNKRAKVLLAGMDLSAYTLDEITGAVRYIYKNDVTFSTKEEANEYIKTNQVVVKTHFKKT